VIAIADLPAGGWTARGLELLGRVALNGPRAGVHIVASLDRSAPTPSGFDTDTMVSPATVTLIDADDRARINDRELGEIMFIPDGLPEVGKVSDWLAEAGRAFATRSRVLSADRVLPALDWAGSSGDGVEVPIGLNEEGELLALRVSDDPVRGPAHGLVGGMTGMGKSNLLNLLIAGISSRYSPDEVGLYLLDFKQGVGFAPYRSLPHARAVALETEREFALSVLLDLQEEMGRRGPLFTAAGVQKFADYRGRGRPLQRLILLIDEFQVLVGADDTVGRDAAAVLETLVKQGAVSASMCSCRPSRLRSRVSTCPHLQPDGSSYRAQVHGSGRVRDSRSREQGAHGTRRARRSGGQRRARPARGQPPRPSSSAG